MAKRDNARAARLLAEAALTTDAKVCESHGITLRTLQNYRAALKTDPELSRLYAEARQVVITRDWAEQLGVTLSGAAAKLLALIDGAQSSAPETIQAVTGAVLGLAEIALTRDMLAARLNGPQDAPAGDRPPQPHALN
ncbi:hypothetical protein HLB42_09690 [Deinococcus sp. D7000]|nr:hypothetical protein HLB42_09690 [Deinococcus sp. D7000]